jgi:hypothetical protein
VPNTYYDALYIRVGLIDKLPSEPDFKVLEVFVQLPGGSADVNEIAAAVDTIADGRSHIFTSAGQHIDWGFDSAWLSYGIDVGLALGVSAIYDGIKTLIKKFPSNHPLRRYTDTELVEHGARLLARQGGFRSDELKATGIERPSDPATATVRYVRNGTEEFDVTIRMIEGIPVVLRQYRDLP